MILAGWPLAQRKLRGSITKGNGKRILGDNEQTLSEEDLKLGSITIGFMF